jgi:ACS family hexuronate transporter-like MFS transporter
MSQPTEAGIPDSKVPDLKPPGPGGRYRWTICALLFAATTINYMDRSVLGVLAPTLQYKVFDWSDTDYARINIAFKVAYAVGMLSMGAIIDRLGTRIGYTLSIAIWSIFGMLHAAVRPAFSVLGFCVARFGLGFGESGNFPAAIKTVGEWFPKRERAFATGIFNAGSNVGAILAPLIIPLVVWPDGTNWQYAFLTTGVFSALWVVTWWKIYRRPEVHPRLSKAELAYINSDSVSETSTGRLSWWKVLPHRETWAFAAAKITDAVWWFYLFWGGKFLYDKFGLNIKSLALPLITIYVLADGGSVAGGWLSSFFIKRGWPVNRARKTTLLICATCILPVMFVTQISTHFNIDTGFFDRLQTATFATEKVVTVDGSTRAQRAREHVPADVQTQLHSLSGQSYDSAKEFIKAASGVLATARVGAVEAALPANAQTYDVDAAFVDRIRQSVSVEAAEALRSLRGNQYDTRQAFVAAVSGAIGKAEANRMDNALLSSARTNNYIYWIAVLLIALGAGGHQAWSANIFTLVSDVFPKKATASVTGIGGMVGAVAGILGDNYLGQVLTTSGPAGYFFAFLVAGSCYLILLGVVHLLMPRMTPLDENLKHVRT